MAPVGDVVGADNDDVRRDTQAAQRAAEPHCFGETVLDLRLDDEEVQVAVGPSIAAEPKELTVVAIGATAVGLMWLFSSVISFLQPFLIPFAVAGVLVYKSRRVWRRVQWGRLEG